MAEVRLRACDVCGRHEGQQGVVIKRITLEVDGERGKAELCGEDAQPAVDLLKKVGGVRRRGVRQDFGSSMVDDPGQIPRDGHDSS